MKEKPILFNTEMVKAILNGSKIETRRVIKKGAEVHTDKDGKLFLTKKSGNDRFHPYNCPYGKVGDQLWVRETFLKKKDEFHSYVADYNSKMFLNTEPMGKALKAKFYKRIPSLFMPRWASRIQLEITEIKVERVQDITEDGAEKEGVFYWTPKQGTDLYTCWDMMSSYEAFRHLWNSINEKSGYGWENNPFVWVVKFKVVKP